MIARGVRRNTELFGDIPNGLSPHYEGRHSRLSGRESEQASEQCGIGEARYLGIGDKNDRCGVPGLTIVWNGNHQDGGRLQCCAGDDETAGYALAGAPNQLTERFIVKDGFHGEGIVHNHHGAAQPDYLLGGPVGNQYLPLLIQDQDRNGKQVQT